MTTAYLNLRPANSFTADDAYEADQEGEPIVINQASAKRIISKHGCEGWDAFLADVGDHATYNAWTVLEWLGY